MQDINVGRKSKDEQTYTGLGCQAALLAATLLEGCQVEAHAPPQGRPVAKQVAGVPASMKATALHCGLGYAHHSSDMQALRHTRISFTGCIAVTRRCETGQ